MVTLSVMQALLGHTSEARWLRFADEHLRHPFPYLPKQPGYNKRLRRIAATLNWLVGALARDTSVWSDDVWVVDSTPVECARSRETVKRSDLAGWAKYGYCASHSRLLWGLRLHLVGHCTGCPSGSRSPAPRPTNARYCSTCSTTTPPWPRPDQGKILLADKNYFGREFEASIASAGIQLLRRARNGEPERPDGRFFKPLRQTVKSIFDKVASFTTRVTPRSSNRSAMVCSERVIVEYVVTSWTRREPPLGSGTRTQQISSAFERGVIRQAQWWSLDDELAAALESRDH